MANLDAISIIIPFILNWILFDCRKSKWVRSGYKWLIVATLFIIGLALYYFYEPRYNKAVLIFWGLMTPLVFSTVDSLFKRFSILFYGRDYHLWIRGSAEVQKRVKFRAGDRVFSLFNIFFIMILPFIPAIFFNR